MRNVLHLSGGELITYAIVFRASQSKTGIYIGGIPYVAEFVGCSKETARKYLHTLESRGLIAGEDFDKNGVRYRNYQVIDNHIPKNLGYIPKNLGEGTQKYLVGVPKNFGLEEYNRENKTENNPPTPQDVAAYAKHIGFADPEGFAAYYCSYQTENGWMMGKGKNRKPIDNWKLNVVSWSKYHKNDSFPAPANAANTKTMSKDDFKRMFASK